jgi:hypothetical protein
MQNKFVAIKKVVFLIKLRVSETAFSVLATVRLSAARCFGCMAGGRNGGYAILAFLAARVGSGLIRLICISIYSQHLCPAFPRPPAVDIMPRGQF